MFIKKSKENSAFTLLDISIAPPKSKWRKHAVIYTETPPPSGARQIRSCKDVTLHWWLSCWHRVYFYHKKAHTNWFFTDCQDVEPLDFLPLCFLFLLSKCLRLTRVWFQSELNEKESPGSADTENYSVLTNSWPFRETKFKWRLILKHRILKITRRNVQSEMFECLNFILKSFLWDLLVLTNIQIVVFFCWHSSSFLVSKELLSNPILGDITHSYLRRFHWDAEIETHLP